CTEPVTTARSHTIGSPNAEFGVEGAEQEGSGVAWENSLLIADIAGNFIYFQVFSDRAAPRLKLSGNRWNGLQLIPLNSTYFHIIAQLNYFWKTGRQGSKPHEVTLHFELF